MPSTGIAGKVSRGPAEHVRGSWVAENTIDFGDAVVLGSNPTRQVAAYNGSTVVGIAEADETKGFTRDSNGNPVQVRQYKAGDPCAIVRRGTIYVTVAAAVTAGKQAYIVSAAGDSGRAVGDIVDADTPMGTGTKVAIPGSVFRTSGSASGVAELELNLP